MFFMLFFGGGFPTAGQDAQPPYLYYYSSVLNVFVVERADGSDSRMLGMNLIHDQVSVAGWSPSGNWFAWTDNNRATGGFELHVIGLDGTSQVERAAGDKGYSSAKWSPVDDRLFIVESGERSSEDENPNTRFILLDVPTAEVLAEFAIQINEGNSLTGTAWSPDGQFVGFYYHNYRGEARKFESTFVLVSRDGEVTQQAFSPTSFHPDIGIGVVHWTPQGWLAHFMPDKEKILVTNPKLREQFEVDAPQAATSSSTGRAFLWSETGEYALMYVSLPRSPDTEATYDLWLLSIPERRFKRVIEHIYGAYAYYFDPFQLALFNFDDADFNASWSPDGRRAVFPITADGRFAVLDPATGETHNLPLAVYADDFGRYEINIRWTPDSQSLEFENDTAQKPVQTINVDTNQTDESDTFTVIRSAYSPSGRYLATAGMAGTVIDTTDQTTYVLPIHSASVYNKTQFLWDSSEEWLITEDYLCIAGDCPAILRYAVTNPQGTYWRELEDSKAAWLPLQVNVSKLPPGAPESILLAPERIDRNVEFQYGSEDQSLKAGCDPEDAFVLLIQERDSGKTLYRLHDTQPCSGEGGDVYIGVSPDGRLLALASRYVDSTATLWHLPDGELAARINCTCFDMEFSPDSSELFTRASSAMLIWDVEKILAHAQAIQPPSG
jgi:WD40 repeat protein